MLVGNPFKDTGTQGIGAAHVLADKKQENDTTASLSLSVTHTQKSLSLLLQNRMMNTIDWCDMNTPPHPSILL